MFMANTMEPMAIHWMSTNPNVLPMQVEVDEMVVKYKE